MKIPIKNIYYLLCYAWNKLEERDIVEAEAEEHTSLLNLFARVLILGTNRLIKRGIDRDYQRYDEVIKGLRGKINFQESLKRHLFHHGKAHCQYDEMDHDVLHNRILKTTMKKLISIEGIEDAYRDELIYIVRRFHYISDIDLKAYHFSMVRLHRNNYFYDFLLKICRLIYDNLLIHEGAGESKFMDFLQDENKMWNLFESFLRQFYRLEQDDFVVSRENIEWAVETSDPNAKKYLPIMQTDISLKAPDRKIIMDAKYYKDALGVGQYGAEKIHSAHLYQLSSYLKNLEVKGGVNLHCEGMLIYPTVKKDVNLKYDSMLGHKVSVRTINLNQDWRQIHGNLLSFLA
jgi:5-methylcytosine-specific restriction enzyme subunit McrC